MADAYAHVKAWVSEVEHLPHVSSIRTEDDHENTVAISLLLSEYDDTGSG
jgi:hypothetical protein